MVIMLFMCFVVFKLSRLLPPPPTKTPEVDGPVTEPTTPEVDRPVIETSLIPQFFALIIAIDSYERTDPGTERVGTLFPVLRGCAADAEDIILFLRNNLGVPTDNITRLYDKYATREGIIGAFESLASNTRIPKGASIIIFYAGHGGEIPSGTDGDEMIQILIPHDFEVRKDPSDAHPVATNGLEDYKIGELLTNIANSKGNNITVILDCCHSGSGTRDAGSKHEDMGTPRSILLPPDTRLANSTPSASLTSPTARGVALRDQDKNRFLGSHVVFGACHQTQRAYEKDGRGLFTVALTTLLRKEDLQQLTYSKVVESLPPLPNQTPQCDGVNKDHIFLTNKAPEPQPTLHRVTKNSNGTYELNAGDAQGVIFGAEFAIYETNACTKELGRLGVSDVQALTSALTLIQGELSFDTAYARQTHIGAVEDVHLFVELDSHLASVFASVHQKTLQTAAHRPFFKVTSSPEEKPDLSITAIEPECTTARLKITDTYCNDAGLYEIPYHPSTDQQTMTRILCGAANFYWYLHCRRTENDIITSNVNFQCYELSDGINMCAAVDNLFRCGVIHIPFGGQPKPYGFRLDNNSQTPLFVSMFFFNMSELSIYPVYQPPAAAAPGHRPSLEAGRSLTIGYGTGGALPLSFQLGDGLDVDVVYLKIFLSTRYVDYRMLPQASPFLGKGRVGLNYVSPVLAWGTMLIPIVQKREGV